MKESNKMWWEVPWEFALHAATGILVFTVIALAALSISFLCILLECIVWKGEQVVGPVVIAGLKLGEYAIFFTDLALLLIFLCQSVVSATEKFG